MAQQGQQQRYETVVRVGRGGGEVARLARALLLEYS
jgi:hypothetical protein